MGVNIHCGKHESMRMSYSTFDLWRLQLANILSEDFYAAYEYWLHPAILYDSPPEVNTNAVTKANRYFERTCSNTQGLTQELLEFFTSSDCDGKISSNTSKQLLPLIEKLNDTYKLGYSGVCPYSKEFVIDFFKYSVKHHANVWWN